MCKYAAVLLKLLLMHLSLCFRFLFPSHFCPHVWEVFIGVFTWECCLAIVDGERSNTPVDY